MSDWYTIGAAGLGVAGNIMGIGQQNQQTQSMMNQQMHNQMILNNQMQNIQQQNWDYTNYGNQRKHIENAGLNVGLLYGMGGAGGSTMGGASGGSAAGGHAAQMPNFMEVGQQMLQAKALESQIKVNESIANKNNADASSIKGEEGTIGASQIKLNISTASEKDIANAYMTEVKNVGIKMPDGSVTITKLSGNDLRTLTQIANITAQEVARDKNYVEKQQLPEMLKIKQQELQVEVGKLAVMYKMAQNDARRNELTEEMNNTMKKFYEGVNELRDKEIGVQQQQWGDTFARQKWQYWTDKTQHNIDNTLSTLVPWYTPPTTIQDSGTSNTTVHYDANGNRTGSSKSSNTGNTRTISRGK